MTRFEGASSGTGADALDIRCKNCRMRQLLLILKMCCHRSLVFKFLLYDIDISQGSVATHLRCSGIFSDSIITNFLLILPVKEVLKIGRYFIL